MQLIAAEVGGAFTVTAKDPSFALDRGATVAWAASFGLGLIYIIEICFSGTVCVPNDLGVAWARANESASVRLANPEYASVVCGTEIKYARLPLFAFRITMMFAGLVISMACQVFVATINRNSCILNGQRLPEYMMGMPVPLDIRAYADGDAAAGGCIALAAAAAADRESGAYAASAISMPTDAADLACGMTREPARAARAIKRKTRAPPALEASSERHDPADSAIAAVEMREQGADAPEADFVPLAADADDDEDVWSSSAAPGCDVEMQPVLDERRETAGDGSGASGRKSGAARERAGGRRDRPGTAAARAFRILYAQRPSSSRQTLKVANGAAALGAPSVAPATLGNAVVYIGDGGTRLPAAQRGGEGDFGKGLAHDAVDRYLRFKLMSCAAYTAMLVLYVSLSLSRGGWVVAPLPRELTCGSVAPHLLRCRLTAEWQAFVMELASQALNAVFVAVYALSIRATVAYSKDPRNFIVSAPFNSILTPGFVLDEDAIRNERDRLASL